MPPRAPTTARATTICAGAIQGSWATTAMSRAVLTPYAATVYLGGRENAAS